MEGDNMSEKKRQTGNCEGRVKNEVKRGYSIGVRLIDDFLARSAVKKCRSYSETADMIAQIKMRQVYGMQVLNHHIHFTFQSFGVTKTEKISVSSSEKL
ncbi:hypothetical protein DUI87_10624 [Hirundo rustica rustica]|uniref:Uncharacterized protein n=1 Tax=Hirundo rustica rustica TaxID=333673 RepID=A0A3M0KJ49_HIRRU|nr:hypothetical protein DUI87_10624 [Hirundo rustica rustica]